MMLSIWLKTHFLWVRLLLHVLCTLPALYLLWAYFQNHLGENPLETLTHTTGRTSLILLVLTLTITPLKKFLSHIAQAQRPHDGRSMSGWNWLIRLRRPLGLWSFMYGAAHAWVFIEFDVAYEWGVLLTDVQEKPYLLLGMTALLLFALLAITSIPFVVRRMGKSWLALHRLVYLIALLALFHFWMLLKPGVWRAWPETLAVIVLLSSRLLLFLSKLKGASQKKKHAQTVSDIKRT